MRRILGIVVVVLGVGTSAPVVATDDGASVAAALALCRDADALPADDKDAQRLFLESGIEVAEKAAAAHPDDVKAQLALSCLLGKQLEISGLSWRSFQRLARLKVVVDTALRLAPDDPDALVAKGEMLHQLPCALGGDVHEAEQLLRLAIARDPDHVRARLSLAHLLAERHDREARREASVALQLAERGGTAREKSDARLLYGRASP